MSAFLCSDEHLSLLAQGAHQLGVQLLDRTTNEYLCGTDVVAVLYLENMASLAARYPSATPAPFLPPPAYTETACKVDMVTLLKQIHCYRYQACEHDGWEASDAYAFTKSLEAVAVRKLPGYSAAPWGV